MDSRRLRADVYLALKTEFRETRKEVGSQERAAELTRVDQQTISLYENRNSAHFPPIDVVADMLDVTGSTALLQRLADIVGAVVIKLPEGVGPACVIESSGKMAAQLGKAMMAIGQALADGQISEEESARIVGKLQGIIVSAHTLAEQIKAEAAK